MGAVTSYSGRGLRDWLIQRATAVYMFVYLFALVWKLICASPLTYITWQAMFATSCMRVATVLFFLCLIQHAWIGMWTVATDYIKPVALRILFYGFVLIVLLGCFVWAVDILWSVNYRDFTGS